MGVDILSIWRLFQTTCLAVTLSGCFSIQLHLDIRPDGKMDYNETLQLSKEMSQLYELAISVTDSIPEVFTLAYSERIALADSVGLQASHQQHFREERREELFEIKAVPLPLDVIPEPAIPIYFPNLPQRILMVQQTPSLPLGLFLFIRSVEANKQLDEATIIIQLVNKDYEDVDFSELDDGLKTVMAMSWAKIVVTLPSPITNTSHGYLDDGEVILEFPVSELVRQKRIALSINSTDEILNYYDFGREFQQTPQPSESLWELFTGLTDSLFSNLLSPEFGDTSQIEIPLTRAMPDTLEEIEIVTEPKLIKVVKPVYPERARLARIEGKVIMTIIIDEQGNVIHADILIEEPPGIFGQAAIDAVMQYKFEPAKRDGKPFSTQLGHTIIFTLMPEH